MEGSDAIFGVDLKRKLDVFDADDSALERKKQSIDTDKSTALEAITVTMDCPAISVGAIIGKKGTNVQEIMKRSGCRIVIDQSDQRDGFPKKVNLTGPPDKLAVAMALVSMIIKDGANALTEDEPEDDASTKSTPLQAESKCPKTKVGEVIGVKGATIAEIMRRSSCKVRIVQDAADGNVTERQVIYNGTMDQISAARALVQSVIDEGASILGIPIADHSVRRVGDSGTPAITVEESIEPEKVGMIIGSKGSMIMEIMKKSGAKVIINQDFPKGQPHRIIYTGQKDQVETAKALVTAVMNKGPNGLAEYGSSQTAEEINILQKQTGRVLGPQGSTIKEMQSRFGVKMNIQVSDSAKGGEEGAINVLRISGTVDSVRNARLCLNFILSGGGLESYNFPAPLNFGGMGVMGGSNGFPPSNQFAYNNRPLGQGQGQAQGQGPQFNNAPAYYPPALTSSGYGQTPPMLQPPYVPMNQNQNPNYGSHMNNGHMGQNMNQHQIQSLAPNQMTQNPSRAQQSAPMAAPAAAPVSQGVSLGLGADGTSGILEPPVTQADGSHSQIANVRVDVIGKIIGKAGVNITLIKTKSGASVQVVKSAVVDPNGYSKVVIAGSAPDVYLATQMIQEILVNGPSKLSQLPDKTTSTTAGAGAASGAAGYKSPQAQASQGFPSGYAAEASYGAPTQYNQAYPTQGQGQYGQQGGAMYSQTPQTNQAPHQYGQSAGYQQSMTPSSGMPYNYNQQYQQQR